jgi:hypothetical protein
MKTTYIVMGILLLFALIATGMGQEQKECKACDTLKNITQDTANAVTSNAAILTASIGSLTAGKCIPRYNCHKTVIPYCCASKNGRCIKMCSRTSTVCHSHC